ncbi:cellulase (glycosyl hydrolase family 5) [Raoultella sp. BIGb0138]|uniref:cellulase family glycosylhydrolase n=1 Tax=Raoultella sp. BIGb0138 TaxID=2485115 RepID=UPI001045AC51|nr:cellulase family glycosylhydrolase [Raoultella sp. BIGb0138]TCW17788.1 cellulase (glycosyl hydrolase family 5) [Raoultella sp. BIGb0138]
MIRLMKGLLLILVFWPLIALSSMEIGVCTHFGRYKNDPAAYLRLLKQYGFTSFRGDYGWGGIEEQKNIYKVSDRLRKSDQAFMESSNYGISGMLILAYGNKHYDSGGYPLSEDAVKGFANYAAWTAKRFKGKVKYYEVWNEWTNGTGIQRSTRVIPSANDYFNLVKATSIAIRQVDPSAIVIAGGFNSLNGVNKKTGLTGTEWFNILVEKGILKYIDGVSIHPYSFQLPDVKLKSAAGNINQIDKFHEYFKRKYNVNISVYLTEYGVPVYSGVGGTSESIAAFTIKNYISEAKKRDYIKGVWLYDLIDDGPDKSNREHNFGLFRQNLKPKTAALELQKLDEK